jgi:PAS domain S-box-containing protein
MESRPYRQELYDLFESDVDVETTVDTALSIGCEYLEIPLGFRTRIREGVQEIVQVVGDHELITPGASCPLDEAYCRRTIEITGPLSVDDASTSSDVDEVAFERFDLGTYIGVSIEVDDETHGTVCFADEASRETEFTEQERMFVELLGHLVGQAMEHAAYETTLEDRNEKLRRETELLEGIAENSFDVLYRIGPEGTFTYISQSVERVLGYDPDGLIGTAFLSYASESDRDRLADVHATVLSGEPIEQVVVEFEHVDGQPVLLEINATSMYEDDEIVGTQGVARDVTDRVQRQRELRVKNRAFDEADLGISIARILPDGVELVYVNEGFERLTGYGSTEALGKDWSILEGPKTDPQPLSRLEAAVENRESASEELLQYKADGTPFWARARLSPVHDETGSTTHLIGFHDDVTGQQRNEQLVRLLNRVLRHNLRNDMNIVLGYGELIAQAEDETIAGYGERIASTAKSLIELGEQAKTLEQVAQRERSPEAIDPSSLVLPLVEDCRSRYPAAEIDGELQTDLAICAGPEIETAIAELLTNAAEHNPSPTPNVRITVTDEGDWTTGDGEWITLEVVDDGPGIEQFETGMIANGEETPLEHGSGLGLWLVNWIVTRYGGSFRIEAVDDGEGSVATIRLPAIGEEATVEEAARPPTVLSR